MSPARIANGIVLAMKSQPALLAILVMQLATMVMVYFVANANAERQLAREMAVLSQCLEKGK
jgi:hypothetical protein